jgi:multidrug efflux pump
MQEYEKEFPEGIIYEIGYDTTPYISASINEVWKALRDATILVAVVVLVFLQSWRAAIIPLATIPVAIVGTLAAMYAVGFGINNLTLFGLVLAVGIVVDDAIVVVEAVQHQLEKGLSPRDATLTAMGEVSGPVIAVGLVLTAVFIPCMFLSGIVGLFFRQFALTIAISTLISTFLSLTLAPALAVVLLKPTAARPDLVTRLMNLLFGWFFWLFNKSFVGGGWAYAKLVGVFIRVPLLLVTVYAGLGVLGYRTYQLIPAGFIPTQDKGYLIGSVQLPDASSAEQTRETMMRVVAVAKAVPGVKHVNAVAGNSFALSAYGSNFGSMFIILDDFEERRTPELYSANVAVELNRRINAEVPKATVNVFPAPAVPGLGRSGGVRLMVQDRGEVGNLRLQQETDHLIRVAANQPAPGTPMPEPGEKPVAAMFQNPFTVFKVNSPQVRVLANEAECKAAGVSPLDLYATMSATLGQRYVNDFNRFGRTFQVNVQAAAASRNQTTDVRRLRVRNSAGELVPVGALADVRTDSGPLVVTRYNTYPAAAINANLAPGVSSGDARVVFKELAGRELPPNMGCEWTELMFIEEKNQDTGVLVFVLAVVVVFLVLAALYESWSLPLAVILVVPMCVISSLAGVWLARQDFNLFTAVGLVVLVGLACKNAILIVEYAKHQREAGASRREAVLAACRLRLRPILMTSVAFILGVTPLAFGDGAGSEMRRALGVTVFAGMIGVTAFGVFLTPVFFVLVDWFTDTWVVKSVEARWVGRAFLFVFAFGWVRWLVRQIQVRVKPKKAVPS